MRRHYLAQFLKKIRNNRCVQCRRDLPTLMSQRWLPLAMALLPSTQTRIQPLASRRHPYGYAIVGTAQIGETCHAAECVGNSHRKTWWPINSVNPVVPQKIMPMAKQSLQGRTSCVVKLPSFAERLQNWAQKKHSGMLPKTTLMIMARSQPINCRGHMCALVR